ncbi:leucine-rich repeat protein [Coprobacter secundus]|nr:leucine-rich repeat protein [uncultured Coprobacter sp.]
MIMNIVDIQYSKLILAFFCISFSFSIKAYDFENEKIYYNITSSADLTVGVTYRYYDGILGSYSGEVTIPETVEYNGKVYTVTSIEPKAFNNCTHLSAVSIPNSVITIGDEAFSNCYSSLKSIIIPDNVISIGRLAFYNCNNLISVTIGKNVTSIGDNAFNNCSKINSIVVPDNVETIGNYAFNSCRNLTSIIIGNGITSIGDNAFSYCDNLVSICFLSIVPPKICSDWKPNNAKIHTLYPDAYKKVWSEYSSSIQDIIKINSNIYEYTGVTPQIQIESLIPNLNVSLKENILPINVGKHSVKLVILLSKDSWSMETRRIFDYTITPAPLRIRANNISRLYGDENPQLTFTCIGFKNNETEDVFISKPSIKTDAIKTSNVGKYLIYVTGGEAVNYEITEYQGILTVEKRPLSVSVGNYTRKYNEPNPEFKIIYSGFVNNETDKNISVPPIITCNATKSTDVGTYSILLSGGEATNYTFNNYTNGSLTIKQTSQEIIWEQDLSNLEIGSQVELTAYSTSGLDITYLITENNTASIYKYNGKTMLNCFGPGTITIRATQDGNHNYLSALRVAKFLTVQTTTEIGNNQYKDISCYPIPVTDILNIKGIDKGSIQLINSNGSLLKTEQIKEKKLPQINVSELNPEIYFVKIQTENKIIVKKIIKE